MIRFLTLLAFLSVILAGEIVMHKRINHIETAVGINADNPDGQIYASFRTLMEGMTHIHNDLERHAGKDREYKPLQEKEKDRTYDIYREAQNN